MLRTRLMVAGLLVTAAACSSTGTTAVSGSDDAVITLDAASVAADGFSEDADMIMGMDGSVGGSAFLMGGGGYRPGLTGCTFAGGSFTCPAVTKNGLSVTRTITLKDSTGATQSAYDSLTTASIHVVADLTGDVTHGSMTASVTRHRDFTVTGLAGTETSRTVNGTGNETVSRSRVTHNDSTRTYDVVGNSVITSVVLPVRASDGGNGWPLSGTITRTLTITVTNGPNAGKTVTRTATITFNGTSSATATVNGSTFTIDLSGHTATGH